ncbi:MAG: sigma-70 family RNA polymerase sigma factor [Pirellulales bacterium]|nr:sigma-70 family RNA polymerase sigma factor [Pirellulales bacterium]
MLDTIQSAEFVRLWTLHGQRIYAYLLALSSNYADADEIYQEVGMTLWQKFDQFTPGTNFHAWARQVGLNKVRNFRLLRRHDTMLCSPELLDAINHTVEKTIDTLDSQHQVFADCFEKLSPRNKDLLERRYQPGATPRSVAKQMGRNVNSIYVTLSRIHNALLDCVRKATLGGEAS